VYLVTAREMRELDRRTIEELGIPGVVLMENAGRAAAREIMLRFSGPGKAVVLAGCGNNGGDGWVVARYLSFAGWEVEGWLVGEEEKLAPDARVFYEVCCRLFSVHRFTEGKEDALRRSLQTAVVTVDALLGTGAKGELRPLMRKAARLVNEAAKGSVVALDLPTGVDADTGAADPDAVRADVTVTFQFPKWGHFLRPGADLAGEVQTVEIGLWPTKAGSACEPAARLNRPDLWREHLRRRDPWSHKGTHGHLLVIGGSRGMMGAVVMAGEAAYRTGAGLVTLTAPASQETVLAAKVTQELIWCWPGEGIFAPESSRLFSEREKRFTAVAVGPGLGRFPGEERWLGHLLEQVRVPMVLDADALNILADHPELFKRNRPERVTVLTPHPGEMARLLRCSVAEVETNRRRAAEDLAKCAGVTVVLKGRYTLIAFPDGRTVLNDTGGPALAKAGSGDWLTGMIGSFLAQGMPMPAAVPLAVWLHGKAGEQAGRPEPSMLSRDFSRAVADEMARLLEEHVSP
jgi:NAD(P)H-hydrate epimerase